MVPIAVNHLAASAVAPRVGARWTSMGNFSGTSQGATSGMQNNGDMQYRIRFVGERELPPDQDFAFMECDDQLWLAIKRNRISPPLLEECWGTYRQMAS